MPERTLGIVVDGAGGRPRLEELDLDPPGRGEARVRIAASGVCHSDAWAIEHGNWDEPFPMLLGHEGAGIVEDVGDGVSHVAPGDAVLLAWAVPDGTCAPCRRGDPRRCAHGWSQPPRVRVAPTGEPLKGTLSLGTLATHTVVHAAELIPVPPDTDLTRACLLGCGASTGIGAVINTAELRPGATVAVIGLGGIGLSAVQGARIAGAARIVAIDLFAAKLEAARALGATDTVDASLTDAVAGVRELTDDVGVDAAFEATGVPSVVAQAVDMLSRAGVAVAIGVPPPDSRVALRWGGHAYSRKVQLRVTDGGDPLPEDLARWVGWFRDGSLDLGALVTVEAELSEAAVEEALRAMFAGEVIRTVIRMPL